MIAIAENGFGEYIDHWTELSPRERIEKLIGLSLEYDVPWMLCPNCYRNTRPYAPRSIDKAADSESDEAYYEFFLCDVCGAETPEHGSTWLSPGLMRVLSEDGYGMPDGVWQDLDPADRREKLLNLTSTYETPWTLCPACLQSVHAFLVERDSEETEDRSHAAQRGAQKEEIPAYRRVSNVIARIFFFCLSLVLFLYGIGHLINCNETLTLPGMALRPGHVLPAYLDPRNGLQLSLGLVLVCLGLLVLNTSLRRKRGPIDWILGGLVILVEFVTMSISKIWDDLLEPFRESFGMVTVVVILVGLGIFGAILWSIYDYNYYFSPEDAAQAFETQVDESTLTNSGDLLFGRGKKSGTHVAPITPSLVRALDRRNVQIGGYQARQRELAVPGILPVLFLVALLIFSMGWNLFKRPYIARVDQIEAEAHQHARVTLLFGLTSLYVVFWLALGQFGNEMQIFGTQPKFIEQNWENLFGPQVQNPAVQGLERVFGAFQETLARIRLTEWFLWAILLGTGGIALMGSMYFKLDQPSLPEEAREGWGTLYFFVHLGAIAGICLLSFKSPGSPVFFWIIGYTALGLLLWFVSRPRSKRWDL